MFIFTCNCLNIWQSYDNPYINVLMYVHDMHIYGWSRLCRVAISAHPSCRTCAVCAEAPAGQVEEAHRQIEQALQTADHQIEALRARVTKKNAQLSDAKLQLEHIREDMHDIALSQRHAPPSLPDTESSDQTGNALLCLYDLSGHLKSRPCFVRR